MASADRGARAGVRLIVVVAGVALVVLGALWFGHSPPRSADAYRQQAIQAIDYLRSQTQTARLWVDAVTDGDSTHQAAAVAVTEAEKDARATADRFAAYDPPLGEDRVRHTMTGLGDDVVDALSDLRIAVHRGQWNELGGLSAHLTVLADRLTAAREAFTGAASP